ncbi:2-hydroxyacid dehydrogenase [Hoeflea sp. YIM 152468]|uniref:2-hydroxyacid dehydrogenase n=1 Tax=Hoeflea sp. YIM 152468 TaxID=3031759 RepID=UPI0023D9B728|nr:2-hydroxyacid dehydrogenase [Hoeflea sp. YIM 152468]MDF1609059.1 2-hydroxyacid dehydrogenase [Hoeflea sp. YIM 152468]
MAIEILLAGKIPADDAAALKAHFKVHTLADAKDAVAFLAEIGSRIRGLVVTGFRGYDKALLNALPNVQIVSVWGAGVSELDLEAARNRGIAVAVTPDDSKVAVAELGLGLMLASARWIPDSDQHVRSGKWEAEGYPRMGIGLAGRTCGIVAMGTIGRYVAERAKAFGMHISYFGPREKKNVPYLYQPDLLELARSSEFLVLCCPNTPETRGLINADVLEALGADGTLVNIARGPVVDEDALVLALQEGTIRSAALDVYAEEPHVPEAIRLSKRTVLVAHIGTQIHDVREKRKQFFIQNLEDFFNGRPLPDAARILP